MCPAQRPGRAAGRGLERHARRGVADRRRWPWPKDFLKRNPLPDGPRRAVLGVQMPLEEANDRVWAERVHEQEG
jgi:hypothetical protein